MRTYTKVVGDYDLAVVELPRMRPMTLEEIVAAVPHPVTAPVRGTALPHQSLWSTGVRKPYRKVKLENELQYHRRAWDANMDGGSPEATRAVAEEWLANLDAPPATKLLREMEDMTKTLIRSMPSVATKMVRKRSRSGRPMIGLCDGTLNVDNGFSRLVRMRSHRQGHAAKSATVVVDLNRPGDFDSTAVRGAAAILMAKRLRSYGIQTQLISITGSLIRYAYVDDSDPTAPHPSSRRMTHCAIARVVGFGERLDERRVAAQVVHLWWRKSVLWPLRAYHVGHMGGGGNMPTPVVAALGYPNPIVINNNVRSFDGAVEWLKATTY